MNVLRTWTNENRKALNVVAMIAAMNHFGSLVTCYADGLSTPVNADVSVVAQHPGTSVLLASSTAAQTATESVDNHEMACSGDVNLDGVLSQADLVGFLGAVETAATDSAMYDIDGNGSVDGRDYQRLVELHQNSAAVSAGGSDGPHTMTNVHCCESDGVCFEYAGSCPAGTAQVTCPCTYPELP